jgi:hypothetical protein
MEFSICDIMLVLKRSRLFLALWIFEFWIKHAQPVYTEHWEGHTNTLLSEFRSRLRQLYLLASFLLTHRKTGYTGEGNR